ncbi:unnamed protein product [Amoebophrya sp. A25]|nr:unnamed protein product [Amoebophrya sp. A25]|eukprot:GSA25T00018680001.1
MPPRGRQGRRDHQSGGAAAAAAGVEAAAHPYPFFEEGRALKDLEQKAVNLEFERAAQRGRRKTRNLVLNVWDLIIARKNGRAATGGLDANVKRQILEYGGDQPVALTVAPRFHPQRLAEKTRAKHAEFSEKILENIMLECEKAASEGHKSVWVNCNAKGMNSIVPGATNWTKIFEVLPGLKAAIVDAGFSLEFNMNINYISISWPL